MVTLLRSRLDSRRSFIHVYVSHSLWPSLAIASLATILAMATNRLDLLKQMIAQDPKNSFARYGLAMEYANSGSLEDAMGEFKTLLANDQTYTAAYYHGGQCLKNWAGLRTHEGSTSGKSTRATVRAMRTRGRRLKRR